jgi:predicted nucleic acid-binding protein
VERIGTLRSSRQGVLVGRLGVSSAEVKALERLLRELAPEPSEVPEQVPAVGGDPDDDLILAAAVEAGAEILVSGDTRHLLPLEEHRGMRIIRPQAFLAELAR